MNSFKQVAAFLPIFLIAMASVPASAQVVVNGKDINKDQDLQYIQLMYKLDKATLGPVFFVDFGYIEPEYTDILQPERQGTQRIQINGESVTERVTVVWMLNQMHKAGWEYLGDVVYVPMKSLNNWHVMTLKRRERGMQVAASIGDQ